MSSTDSHSSWHPAVGRYHNVTHERSNSTVTAAICRGNSQPCCQNTDKAWPIDLLVTVPGNMSVNLSLAPPPIASQALQSVQASDVDS